jgi:hypothetical protein
VEIRKPIWTSSSFVVYAGGLTVLGATLGGLSYLSGRYGGGAFVAWALLPLAVLYAVAHTFRARSEWLPAGVFIVVDMVVWIVFLAAVERWWGWLPKNLDSPFRGWHWAVWLLVLVVIATAYVDLHTFRFPLLVVFPALLWYYLVVDVLSGGGSWSAVLTLLFGLGYLALGTGIDRGRRRPCGFWIHLVAGLLVGGALLYWWHSSDLDWALVAATGVVFVAIAGSTGRSSWAVLGLGGFLAAASHWSSEWANRGFSVVEPTRDWVPPVVFGVVGFFFVALGLALERRRSPA